jgi:hypothetical protein
MCATLAKGRYVVAKERLETGEAFFVSHAYSNVITGEMLKFACACCRGLEYEEETKTEYDVRDKTKKTVDLATFIESRRLAEPKEMPIRCEQCKMCYYCCDACKDDHYRSVHRFECELFNKVRKLEESTPDVGLMDLDWDPSHERQLLRHLIRIMAKRYEEQCIGSRSAGNQTLVDSEAAGERISTSAPSMTYQEDILNLIFKTKASEEHERVATEAREVLPLSYQPSDAAELVQVLSRVDCNKFGLFGMKGEVIGSSLHPSASFVNHSCLPNAFSHIVGSKLTLYTLYPVEAGEELNIGYIEPELPIKDRRAQLKETYGFDCICRRCTKEGLKDAPPKQLYEDFFRTHLNCPLCRKGLLMVADEDDIRRGIEEARKSNGRQSIQEPIPGVTEFRSCNGCHKLQTTLIIPSICEYKRTWVNKDAQDKKKKRSKPSKTANTSNPEDDLPAFELEDLKEHLF